MLSSNMLLWLSERSCLARSNFAEWAVWKLFGRAYSPGRLQAMGHVRFVHRHWHYAHILSGIQTHYRAIIVESTRLAQLQSFVLPECTYVRAGGIFTRECKVFTVQCRSGHWLAQFIVRCQLWICRRFTASTLIDVADLYLLVRWGYMWS